MTKSMILNLAGKYSEEVRVDGLFTYSYAFEKGEDVIAFVLNLLNAHEKDIGNPNAFAKSN